MLKKNWEMIIWNATYKTNKYKFPLFIIINFNALSDKFYVGFCFLAQKEEEDYFWTLY